MSMLLRRHENYLAAELNYVKPEIKVRAEDLSKETEQKPVAPATQKADDGKKELTKEKVEAKVEAPLKDQK